MGTAPVIITGAICIFLQRKIQLFVDFVYLNYYLIMI